MAPRSRETFHLRSGRIRCGSRSSLVTENVGKKILHPITFFSKKLSEAEQNYDVGNREMLAIKQWRHWLEGDKYPFHIYTDHKTLNYLRTAKRFNPRQARWSLFFTRFNFVISYSPGSENKKADALSRRHNSKEGTPEEETILPQSCINNTIQCEFDKEIINTLPFLVPENCPLGKQYVPPKL